MSQQETLVKQKLTAKDAIMAGALGAVCIAIRFLSRALRVGGISPYVWFALHFIDAILIGPVFMLLVAKIRQERPLPYYEPCHGLGPCIRYLDVPHYRPCGRYLV